MITQRAAILKHIREFFWNQGFIETDTPALVYSPGMEPHICPIEVVNIQHERTSFLQTSPEFAMKKLLSKGHQNIFQICKCYRQELKSSTHHPEFTMIEWYRSHSAYEKIMDDVEALFESIAKHLYGSTHCVLGAYGEMDFTRPWMRLTVEECFQKFLSVNFKDFLDPSKGLKNISEFCLKNHWCGAELTSTEALKKPGAWDDYFFLAFMNGIEPKLKELKKPCIVYRYPPSQAALANIEMDADGTAWAKRFEVYAGGLELGNAFDELTDATTQRVRFEKDQELRKQIYHGPNSERKIPISPIDEEFIQALSLMPKSAGIAMGIDRIVMLFTGTENIQDVLWQESYWKS